MATSLVPEQIGRWWAWPLSFVGEREEPMPRAELVNVTQEGALLQTELRFECPGCGELHGPIVERPDGKHPCWTWNRDLDRPTLSPSILVRSSRLTDAGYAAYLRGDAPGPDGRFECIDTVCHSFVRDGRIEFLSDCTHPLAGQTVALPEIDG